MPQPHTNRDGEKNNRTTTLKMKPQHTTAHHAFTYIIACERMLLRTTIPKLHSALLLFGLTTIFSLSQRATPLFLMNFSCCCCCIFSLRDFSFLDFLFSIERCYCHCCQLFKWFIFGCATHVRCIYMCSATIAFNSVRLCLACHMHTATINRLQRSFSTAF